MEIYFGSKLYPDYGLRINGKSKVAQANEKVIKQKIIRIRFDYPFGYSMTREYHSKNGFTRGGLVRRIRQAYKSFYWRPTRYGIWGHGIDDLSLDGLISLGNNLYMPDISS